MKKLFILPHELSPHQALNITLEDASEMLNTFKIIHNLRMNGSPEARLAFVEKYVREVGINLWGNVLIAGRFEVVKGTKGAFGRSLGGSRIILDKLTSHNYSSVE